AMACGLPVVASDIKGHRELVEHGVNGLLFSKGNQEQIAILLLEMIYNPNVRHSLFTLSQNKIEEFSLSKVLPQIIKIYNTYFNK
ncbi:MAG: glycosyl transferase group 1, partial [Neobacillus sp.]|nr:glycosyl transferase group 1 [Neobacillus sp.]